MVWSPREWERRGPGFVDVEHPCLYFRIGALGKQAAENKETRAVITYGVACEYMAVVVAWYTHTHTHTHTLAVIITWDGVRVVFGCGMGYGSWQLHKFRSQSGSRSG